MSNLICHLRSQVSCSADRAHLDIHSIGPFDMTPIVPAARRRLRQLWDPSPFASSPRSWQTSLHVNGHTVRNSSFCEGSCTMAAHHVDKISPSFPPFFWIKTRAIKLESKHVVHNSNISGCQPECQRGPSDEYCCRHIHSLVLYHSHPSLYLPAIHTCLH